MPDTCRDFLAVLDRLKVKLPLKLSPYDMGDIIDSDGRHVCICDAHCERTNEEAVALASCIAAAVNACISYISEGSEPAERTPSPASEGAYRLVVGFCECGNAMPRRCVCHTEQSAKSGPRRYAELGDGGPGSARRMPDE
jgi:hypothetical protein